MSRLATKLLSWNDNDEQETALMIATESAAVRKSPYTPHNVDAAIAHLEQILGQAQAESIFGITYLRNRVMQIRATHGIGPVQIARVARLISTLERVRMA